jgi:hypothetical protein
MTQSTKGNEMTNNELAEHMEKVRDLCLHCGDVARSKQLDCFTEAARRLRELPDPAPPTPTLEDELRELVEKHECFKGVLELYEDKQRPNNTTPWLWTMGRGWATQVTTSAALTVVRGIAKAMCDERGSDWAWKPREQSNHATHTPSKKWIVWAGDMLGSFATTELAAIDALLTVMEGTR